MLSKISLKKCYVAPSEFCITLLPTRAAGRTGTFVLGTGFPNPKLEMSQSFAKFEFQQQHQYRETGSAALSTDDNS